MNELLERIAKNTDHKTSFQVIVSGNQSSFNTLFNVVSVVVSGVRGREVERRPRNLEVPSSIPGSGCQLWDFFIGPHIRREYWCSSQEAESREISISCKNLFLN